MNTFTGYDKLKPFGFPIHAGVDEYSRKVLWVELERSHNLPEITARYYLDGASDILRCCDFA